MIKQVVLFAVLTLSACSTVHHAPDSKNSIHSGVRVLYEYPQEEEFKSLGVIDVNHYRPGWRAPTVSDVLPELKTRAASKGGNALIVRSHQIGQFDRSIRISAEVLSVDWGNKKE